MKPKALVVDREKLKAQEFWTYNEIFTEDNYQVTEAEIKDKIVIDVGANLGHFSLRCIELGAKHVYAIEAQPTIFYQGLVHTVRGFPVTPLNFAVLDIDGKTVMIPNDHVGGSKISSVGEPVETITLKTLVKDLTDDLVLKLDCEGSEFDILMNVDEETMAKFNVIHIELHENTNDNHAYHDPQLIRDRLTKFGFTRKDYSAEKWSTPEALKLKVSVEKWVRNA
jgi:FkbM family methyltransferase